MGSELIYRGHDISAAADAGAYSPKPEKRLLCFSLPFRYLLREQRLLFIFVGMALATAFFVLVPRSDLPSATTRSYLREDPAWLSSVQRKAIERGSSVGEVPPGLKRKGLRIMVTGGAGFVGSHLVDSLIERGDSVIVVDNFFTGRKENVARHFGNPSFELIRHDVVEPLLLEVDQIYHLACPASPVHYKFNPVKTIISFSSLL